MPGSAQNVIVISRSSLVRELLVQFLKWRCGTTSVASHASLPEGQAHLARARVLVCDLAGSAGEECSRVLARIRQDHPQLKVILLDGSAGGLELQRILTAVASVPAASEPHAELTPPEIEVMLAVATGLRNAEIARRLRRSCKTIEKHRASALRKLGFRSVAQLTAYAVQHRLLDADDILTRDRR
jgi:DNA-binding NarL/FixJ family response regulator